MRWFPSYILATLLIILVLPGLSLGKAPLNVLPGKEAPCVFLPDEVITLVVEDGTETPGTLSLIDYREQTVLSVPIQIPPMDPPADPDSAMFLVKDAQGNVLASGQNTGVPFNKMGWFRVMWNDKELYTIARIPDVRLTELQPDSPFGIGAYYAMRFNPTELAIASKMQRLLGAAWDRDELLWDIMEPEQGKWTWERGDRSVIAARENNILILGLLDYWGRWAEPFTDEGYAAYGNYVKTMVNRYKPGGELAKQQGWTDGYGIRHWEIWNEPATFWTGSGEQFGRLMQVASKAAKEADPNAQVFFSEAGEVFNKAAISVCGPEAIDGVTPHYYCPPRTPEDGGADKQMANTPSDFEALGIKDKPFFVSEFGWHATMNPMEQRHQAECLLRSHIYGLSAGLDKMFWYNFVNDNHDKHTSHFGLVNREDWTPRAGYAVYANMVNYLSGATFHERVSPMESVRIFVFEKGEDSVAVLWSSGAEGKIYFQPLPVLTLFDMMGNKLNEFTMVRSAPLKSDPVYITAKNFSAENLVRILENGNVSGISPVEMTINPIAGAFEGTPTLTIDVTNKGKKTITGSVSLNLPDGWTSKEANSTTIELAENETETATFHLTAIKTNTVNQYNIGSVFTDERGSEAKATATLFEMVAPKLTPTIDGNKDEWKDVPFVTLDTPEYAVGLVPYMDWNLSTKFAMAWDEEYLYFCATVRDNNGHQPQQGSLIWMGDSFQLAFDTRTDRIFPPKEDIVGLSLFGLAYEKNQCWQWPTPGNRIDKQPQGLELATSNPEKDTYLYEAKIPRKNLAPLEFENGAQFGFSLLLNDNDGGGRRGWLELTPGIGTGFGPKHFHTWTMTE